MEFERLTGESAKDILQLAGKEDNLTCMRALMHFAIEHSNLIETTKGIFCFKKKKVFIFIYLYIFI